MFTDTYDLQLSCASDAAAAAYIAGVDQSLRLDQPGISELREAIRLDSEFALAHAALARQLQIHGFAEDVSLHLDRALALKTAATPREQAAVDVIVAAARFDSSALQMTSAHIDRYPNDVLVLAHIVGPFGLLAFSGQADWREANVVLLESLENSFPKNDWWYLSSRSFLASEVGDLRAARRFVERAWQLSENGNSAHSWAHLHFEEGALQEGADFVKQWMTADGMQSDMRHHLIWHLALLIRESGGDVSELLSLYKTELDARINDPMPLSTFSDNAALLWRCQLMGAEIEDEVVADVIDYADKHYPNLGFCFADIHRVMAVALCKNSSLQQSLVGELQEVAATNESPLANAMLRYAEGFCAFANNDYSRAVERLQPVVIDSVLLGGSNPQRRIVKETYQAALSAAAR